MEPNRTILRPHATFALTLRTPLALQLFGVTLGMANALSSLTAAANRQPAPDQHKKVSALAFEVIDSLQNALAAEMSAYPARDIREVTKFPACLKKKLAFCYANAIKLMRLLADLDNLAQRWYDLYFLGGLEDAALQQKQQEWRERFRRASRQINKLLQGVQKKGSSLEESGREALS